jgi:hypothetical protein
MKLKKKQTYSFNTLNNNNNNHVSRLIYNI